MILIALLAGSVFFIPLSNLPRTTPHDPKYLLLFSRTVALSLPGIFVGALLLRTREVSKALKLFLSISLTLCLLPFFVFAVLTLTYFFVIFDMEIPTVLLLFFVAPGGVIGGTVISFVCLCLPRNWAGTSPLWYGCIATINIGYLVYVLWLVSGSFH
jgi:hypothetical protein